MSDRLLGIVLLCIPPCYVDSPQRKWRSTLPVQCKQCVCMCVNNDIILHTQYGGGREKAAAL